MGSSGQWEVFLWLSQRAIPPLAKAEGLPSPISVIEVLSSNQVLL